MTAPLLETDVRPAGRCGRVALTILGAFSFLEGWLGAGIVCLGISTPLDLIAGRLATCV